jgi:hypothetical protein
MFEITALLFSSVYRQPIETNAVAVAVAVNDYVNENSGTRPSG